MSSETLTSEGKIYSTWQQPINRWMNQPGSIHNDEVATKIGMRGGTIPGTVHLDHFVPIIQEQFGLSWYKKGSISMYYTYATTHKEDVRAGMAQPAEAETDIQVNAWVETPEGHTVAKGSVACGTPNDAPYVSTVPLANADPEDLRILEGLAAGDITPEKNNVVADSGGGEGEYEGILIRPAAMYQMLNAGFPAGKIKRAVGFFGATEIAICDGPIKLDTPYTLKGEVVCVGASPKTEFAWVDSALTEEATGKLTAKMRHLTRWMKASSPLWQE